jgi:hypothetical protein
MLQQQLPKDWLVPVGYTGHLRQQPARKPAVQHRLQRVEIVVGVVRLEAEGTETGKRTLAGERIDQIDCFAIEEVVSLRGLLSNRCCKRDAREG